MTARGLIYHHALSTGTALRTRMLWHPCIDHSTTRSVAPDVSQRARTLVHYVRIIIGSATCACLRFDRASCQVALLSAWRSTIYSSSRFLTYLASIVLMTINCLVVRLCEHCLWGLQLLYPLFCTGTSFQFYALAIDTYEAPTSHLRQPTCWRDLFGTSISWYFCITCAAAWTCWIVY